MIKFSYECDGCGSEMPKLLQHEGKKATFGAPVDFMEKEVFNIWRARCPKSIMGVAIDFYGVHFCAACAGVLVQRISDQRAREKEERRTLYEATFKRLIERRQGPATYEVDGCDI